MTHFETQLVQAVTDGFHLICTVIFLFFLAFFLLDLLKLFLATQDIKQLRSKAK